MKTNADRLCDIAGITLPLLGVYDVPDTTPFEPFVVPTHCLFECFPGWLAGKSTKLDKTQTTGCPGGTYWMCGKADMPREQTAGYLAGQEGLKCTVDTMIRWLANHPPYRPHNRFVILSPLRDDNEAFLKTVTFFVNPDQLGLLLTGAEYRNAEADRPLVSAPFGPGCGLMLPFFKDLGRSEAVVGGTDIAMRKFLPADTLMFTVTKPMFRQLCSLDGSSFLEKTFWTDVRETRQASV